MILSKMEMNNFFVICLFVILFGLSQNTSAADKPNDWENPQMISQNKEPAHCTLMPYQNLEQALKGERYTSPFFKSLNGKWKFNWVNKPANRPVDFFKLNYDVSNWQMLGYGIPIYLNQPYAFKKNPPYIQHDYNPVGSYRTEFTIPDDWKEHQVFIHFDGVESAFYLWLNGKKVGYSQGSRTPAEFNITKYLQKGKNILAAEVYRWSDGSYLECQDFWRLSGIFRNVYLFSTPNVHIRDFEIRTDLNENYQDAILNITAKIWNYADSAIWKPKVEVSLFDANDNPIGSEILMQGTTAYVAPGTETIIKMKAEVSNPLKWSAEIPNLYKLVLKLKNKDQTEI